MIRHYHTQETICSLRYIIIASNFNQGEREGTVNSQGSIGIRQWLINCCTSPMMLHKIELST